MSKAIELDKENPNWHLYKAKIFKLSGDFKEAEKEFEKSLKTSNNDPYILAELADFYSEIGEFEKADFQMPPSDIG